MKNDACACANAEFFICRIPYMEHEVRSTGVRNGGEDCESEAEQSENL